MGEGTFHTWCGEADLIENRAGDDKGGWDYLVQFKPGEIPWPEVRSLDRLPTSPVCWVQVKATDTAANPAIKVSNWKRMVDADVPVFVLTLNFAGRSAPNAASFMHVDEYVVSRVLHRLRDIPLSEAARLHMHKMALSPRPEDLLQSLDGREMRRRMESVLGDDPSNYHAKKQQWRQRAGHGALRVDLRFTPDDASPDVLNGRLVDFALGLSNEIPSTLIRVEEVRFGIPVAVGPRDLPQRVTLHASERPHANGIVEFATENGLERARLPCRVYHPWSMFPFIPKEHLRYRVATKDFDLIFRDAGGASVSGAPDLGETRSISEWASSMRGLRMLQGSEALNYTIEVGTHARGSIGASGRTISMSPETRSLMEAAVDAATVLSRLGLETDSYRASGSQLVLGAKYLREAERILTADRTTVYVSGEVQEDAPQGLTAGFPVVAAAPIGETLIVVGLVVHGPVTLGQDPSQPVEPSPGKRRFLLKSPDVVRVFIEKVSISKGDNVSLLPYFARATAWIASKGMDIIPSFEGMRLPEPADPESK
jgi:hypothetical protein